MLRTATSVALGAVVCLAAGTHVRGAQPTSLRPNHQLSAARVDLDNDGVDDGLEQLLAERYAPMIYMEPGESNYPVNVDWTMARGHLWYSEQGCTPDESHRLFGPITTQQLLLGPAGAAGPPWIHPDSFGSGHHLTHCSSDDAKPLSTTEPFPEHFGDDQLWYIGDFFGEDFPDSERIGSLDPIDWVTYYHMYPTAEGGVMIQYWHTFAFNQFETFDAHGGDWDASIQVQLDASLNLQRVWFSRHNDDHPGRPFDPAQLRFFEGTHPVMTIDGGGHGAFVSPLDWATCDCTAFSSITGPVGTIVWTRDADAIDDPANLRKASLVCDVNAGTCQIALSDPSGGTVWKTWTAGDVRQAGGPDLEIATYPDASAHGALLNLGEYNPGRQASALLEGQFFPLNGQEFIKYSGRWGTTNTAASDGPRGPVFQGFDGIYRSWYNEGAGSPAEAPSSPWRESPIATLTIQGPLFASNGVQYVAGATTFSLSASQNAVAQTFGEPLAFYRFFAASPAPGFSEYVAPFGLSGGDGQYGIDYYALDALNNQAAIASASVRLDTTPPSVAVVQPAAGAQYVHSATLVLQYAVDDGTGSGVRSFTPKMDGAVAVGGHGLDNGQAIQLLTELTVGTHTFTIDAEDNLGNAGARSVAFSVIVTADSIKDDVRQFLAHGAIKNAGVATSLLAKLDAASLRRDAGDCAAASNIYAALINELQGQSGKGIDAAAARIVIGDAQYLIDHCPS